MQFRLLKGCITANNKYFSKFHFVMKKFRLFVRDIIFPISVIIILGLVMTILLYYIVDRAIGYHILTESNSEKKLEGFVKIIGISISITGFASLIITIIQSRKSEKQTIQESTISLYKEFRSENFKLKRSRAWKVLTKWFDEVGYKESLLSYHLGNPEEVNQDFNEDINAIHGMLEFYMIISVYSENEESLKALNYFYYGWWRHFLYDYSICVESHRVINPIVSKYAKSYLYDVSYSSHLIKLDKLCGLSHIPKNTKIHNDGN